MNRHKRADKRSRILSPEGFQRLQDAIGNAFGEDFRDKPPFQELSKLTELPGERPLDPDTVSRIWHRKKGVYRSKIERLFGAVQLKLNESDHIPIAEDLNSEILTPAPKAIAKSHRESVESDAGSIEERYFRATSNFDSLEPLERKSRIQVLEDIASNKDFPRYHWKVMEFLADFVRRKAPRKEEEEGEEERSPKISEDIQAALIVIGQRDPTKDPPNQMIDLSNTDIRKAELPRAKFQKIILSGAKLQGVNLCEATLEEADLSRTNMEGAMLCKANLTMANLHEASLQEANFSEANLTESIIRAAIVRHTTLHKANLQRADLRFAKLQGAYLDKADLLEADLSSAFLQGTYLNKANLQGANLIGTILDGANLQEADLSQANLQRARLFRADLRGAINLEQQQIEQALGNNTTVLPDDVERPAYWKHFE